MKKLLLLICVLQSLVTLAQNPADVEHNFGSGPGFENGAGSIIVQPDGKIIVNGSAIYRNTKTNHLVRLNPDGSLDPTFNYNYNPQTSISISCLILQPDGKLLIGGKDTYYKKNVVRLNVDGSVDTSFEMVSTFGGSPYVSQLALQADGKILAVNMYASGGGAKSLFRLNTNGSIDSSFDIGTGFNYQVNAVAVQSDGKIVVGGNFSTYQGVAQTNLVRLNANGTKDTSFDIGTGFGGSGGIDCIVLQNEGKILASGSFGSYQGVTQRYLIRLNANGSKDTSFITPDFKNYSYTSADSMVPQPDGKILVSFYLPNGKTSGEDDAVYRFNADGSMDTSFPKAIFNIGTNILNGDADADVNCITLLNNGKILIGGNFTFCRKIIEKGIVCLNADGSKDPSFNKDTGIDFSALCSVVQPDGKILVGGAFDNFQGVTQTKLIRLNADLSKDTSFALDAVFNNSITGLLLQYDGKILVRGDFTNYGTSGRNYLVRLNPDGTRDTSFTKLFDYPVEAMALQPDGKILINTTVYNYPGPGQKKFLRLNSDSTQDNTFNTGDGVDFDNGVSSIVVLADGKILVGGSFTAFKGITQKYLIRLNPDGSKDTSFDPGTVFDFSIGVSKITLQPDGKMLVSGVFSPSTGNYQSFLIRLNSDASKDVSFNQGTGFDNVRTGYGIGINSVVLQKDGKILVGGEFDTFQGIAQNRLTRLNTDGSVDNSFDTGTGFEAPVYSLSLYPDGKIFVGGVFSSYQGLSSSSYMIRLKGTYVEPTVNATTIQTNVVCPGGATGSASASAYSGKSPYAYLWSNGAKTQTITGLPAGSYSCTITDANLSAVTKNFIIITYPDVQRPSITAPATLTVNAGSNGTATGVVLGTPVTSDNCSVASVTNNAPTAFPLGNTTVTWTVKDGSNNTATITQMVIVKDVTKPTIVAPPTINVSTPNCVATGVVLGTPVTADNCSVASVTNNGGSMFPVGVTVVTWTVKDASNNSATASQLVIVKETTLPTITAPADKTINVTTSNCTATGVALGTPVTADNCSGLTVTNDAPSAFSIGNTTVVWTVKDASNNTATATQIITVIGPDTTVTNNSGVLSVAEIGATYQWMTCAKNGSVSIPNQKGKAYSPPQPGSYAVQVSKNGCSVTSSCTDITVLGTEHFDREDTIKLYPNPTVGVVTIDMGSLENTLLSVFDMTGRNIFSKELKGESNTLNISNLPPEFICSEFQMIWEL